MAAVPDQQSHAFLEQHNIAMLPLPTPFPVGPVNCFLFKNDPITLVDTGLNTDKTYEELNSGLKEHGLQIGDIEIIIVTHGHRDHMGLLGRLLEETGAKAYGHPLVDKLGIVNPDDASVRKEFFLGILHEFGVPDETIEEANSLYDRFKKFSEPYKLDYLLEHEGHILGFDTYFVPGHSPSDTLFINKHKNYTIVGDHILTSTNPNPLLRRPEPGEKRPRSLVEYQASLRESRQRELGVCLPGHGGLIFDGHAAIDGILEKHERRSAIIKKLVLEGHTTPYAISRKLFPDLPAPNLHLGLSVSVGHLEVLEELGQLVQSHVNGVLHFEPTGD